MEPTLKASTLLWMFIIPSIFGLSLLVPIFWKISRRRHQISIMLACFFTLTMHLHIIIGMRDYSQNLQPDECLASLPNTSK